MDIKVDGGGGEEGAKTIQLARSFNWSHGRKVLLENKENLGIMEVWRRAWTWKQGELFIVIEDDVEMSVQWFRSLVAAWTVYADLPELAGRGGWLLQNSYSNWTRCTTK